MSHFFVTGPERELYGGSIETGPAEYGHDVCSVVADDKRAAIAAAVKHPDMADYVDEQRSDGLPPFAGLVAENAQCPHGKCFCDLCGEECELCENEVQV